MDKPGVTPLMELGKRSLRIGNPYIREAIGEFFGTLLVGFMCVGAGAQFTVATKDGVESQIVPVLGIILGIMTAILITGGVSGGHVNPAVSISLAVAGELSWYSVPVYITSQFLGAVVGALLGWALIHPHIRQSFGVPNHLTIAEFDMSPNPINNKTLQIAGIFSPLTGSTVFNGLATEFILTCFLIMALCGVVDKQNPIKPPGFLVPILIPLVISSFCFAYCLPTGTLLNPARDVGPRLAAVILGWSAESVFTSKDYEGNKQHWWVVGLFGPILGGMLGAFLYSFIIGPQVNLDHLQESVLSLQEKEAIRHILAANVVSGSWRTASTSTIVPKIPPVTNVNPYPTFSTNNNLIADAYQQRSPYPSSYYSNAGYPSPKNMMSKTVSVQDDY